LSRLDPLLPGLTKTGPTPGQCAGGYSGISRFSRARTPIGFTRQVGFFQLSAHAYMYNTRVLYGMMVSYRISRSAHLYVSWTANGVIKEIAVLNRDVNSWLQSYTNTADDWKQSTNGDIVEKLLARKYIAWFNSRPVCLSSYWMHHFSPYVTDPQRHTEAGIVYLHQMPTAQSIIQYF